MAMRALAVSSDNGTCGQELNCGEAIMVCASAAFTGLVGRATATVFEAETLPHRGVLYQSAYSLMGNRMEAEDVVQDTYLQAWMSFDAFEPGTNCRAWLFSILFNKIRHYRRKWTFRMKLTDDPKTFERTTNFPAEPLCDELTDPDVLAAFRKLPLNFAEFVLLADVQEFSYKEIADTIGCPLGTVMSRISRGRALLRDSLNEIAIQRGILRRTTFAPTLVNSQ
jgi:RNA polymerase sigma-70 factor (ECF subfamily)